MTRTEKLVQHGAEIQRDLNELRSEYAIMAQHHKEALDALASEKASGLYYRNLGQKLSEKLDMMETAVCNLVSMMFRT